MKLRIEIQCDNAAFEDDCGNEVARILCHAAQQIEGGERESLKGFSNSLRDSNGNRVGQYKFDKK